MKKGWRWIEWYQMMVAGAIAIVLVLFTRETRASVLLSRRAKKLRDDLQDDRYQCRSDAERSSISVLMRVSMTRPLCKLRVWSRSLKGAHALHVVNRPSRNRGNRSIILALGRLLIWLGFSAHR